MERLTEKVNDYWTTNDNAHIYYIDKNESVFIGNAIDKLAEFEDFMEEQGFESLEELKQKINKSFKVQDCAEKCGCEINGVFFENEQLMVLDAYKEFNTSYLKKYQDSQKENQKLKDRWNMLKAWITNQKQLMGNNLCFMKETLLQKIEELEKENQNER